MGSRTVFECEECGHATRIPNLEAALARAEAAEQQYENLLRAGEDQDEAFDKCRARLQAVRMDGQLLATALRDLSVAAALFEQTPSDEHRESLNAVQDYVEQLLEEFVEQRGDILPRYLHTGRPKGAS